MSASSEAHSARVPVFFGKDEFIQCIADSCHASASEALMVQARHAAEFLASPACRAGRVGAERARTMSV